MDPLIQYLPDLRSFLLVLQVQLDLVDRMDLRGHLPR